MILRKENFKLNVKLDIFTLKKTNLIYLKPYSKLYSIAALTR